MPWCSSTATPAIRGTSGCWAISSGAAATRSWPPCWAAAGSVACHRRVHLVGLSLGGLLSILAAGPTAAASLVTINSPVLLRRTRAYLAPLARRFVPSYPAEVDPPPDPDLADLWTSPD